MAEEEDVFKGTSGPRTAKIAIVGEAYGREEFMEGRPFVGQSGQVLRRMLEEANIDPQECFFTNVVNDRPPNNNFFEWFEPAKDSLTEPIRGLHPGSIVRDGLLSLESQLRQVRPTVVIAAGNYALWALTLQTKFSVRQDTRGRRVPSGIDNWRGSQWYVETIQGMEDTCLLPIYHPAAIMRAWYQRPITVHDLRRIHQAPDDWRPSGNGIPTFLAPPTFDDCCRFLDGWTHAATVGPFRLQIDVETKFGQMTCIGFAPSEVFAMSIPYVRPTELGLDNYWSETEERVINEKIHRLLLSPHLAVEGQNFLYDTQYIQELYAVAPRVEHDTMLCQHVLFPGTPKSLDYLASLYCRHHYYWKEDHKEWDLKIDLSRLLEYNARDCVKQFEVATAQRPLIDQLNLRGQWEEQKEINLMCLDMMNRGVRIDKEARGQFALDLQVAIDDLDLWMLQIVPQDEVLPKAKTPWYRSDKQIRDFFVEDLGLRLPMNRKTGKPTFGKEAFPVLREKHPEFTKLFDGIENFRKMRTFRNNFIQTPLDSDGRIRCMFGRTETFRLTSSENAFGRGTNLQNIPKGSEE